MHSDSAQLCFPCFLPLLHISESAYRCAVVHNVILLCVTYSMCSATRVHMENKERVIGWIIRAAVELNKERERARERERCRYPQESPASAGRVKMMSHMLLHVLSATMEIEGEGVVCVCRTRNVRETIEGERRQRNRTYRCVLKVLF